MRGLMMDRPLLISSIIDHAALYHGDTEIVSRTIELENVAVGHPEVAEACVIGVSHPKWDERPVHACPPQWLMSRLRGVRAGAVSGGAC